MELTMLMMGQVLARYGRSFRNAKIGPWVIPFGITLLILWVLSKVDSPLTDERYAYRTFFGIAGIVHGLSWVCGVDARSCLASFTLYSLLALIRFVGSRFVEDE